MIPENMILKTRTSYAIIFFLIRHFLIRIAMTFISKKPLKTMISLSSEWIINAIEYRFLKVCFNPQHRQSFPHPSCSAIQCVSFWFVVKHSSKNRSLSAGEVQPARSETPLNASSPVNQHVS